MQEHSLNDAVGASPVIGDLGQVRLEVVQKVEAVVENVLVHFADLA
jgi:hypothetical protein